MHDDSFFQPRRCFRLQSRCLDLLSLCFRLQHRCFHLLSVCFRVTARCFRCQHDCFRPRGECFRLQGVCFILQGPIFRFVRASVLFRSQRDTKNVAAGHTKRESMAGREVRAYRVSPSLSRQSFYVSRPKGRGYRMMPISHDSRFTAYDSPSLFHPRRDFSPYRFIPAPTSHLPKILPFRRLLPAFVTY